MPDFIAENPDFAAEVARRVRQQPFNEALGITLHRVAPGSAELRLPYRPDLTQNLGYFHGGAIATLADVAGGFAGWSLVAAGSGVVTVEFKLSIVAPGLGTGLRGLGGVVNRGRSLIVTRADVWGVGEDGTETLCATALQTLKIIRLPGH